MDTTKYRTQIPVKKDGIFAYEIYLEKDFGMLAERLKVCKPENRRLCIVTDSTVDQYYGDQVEEILASCAKEVTRFVFRAGEENKNQIGRASCREECRSRWSPDQSKKKKNERN